MSLMNHQLWPQLEPHVKIIPDANTKSKRQRLRIEFSRNMPPWLVQQALALTMPCVKCGRSIRPIRARKPPTGRGSNVAQGLYYAPCCPLKQNIGCSRGDAASEEYERFREHFGY